MNNCPLNDFSEAEYLTENEDVREAVHNGVFSTGWDHFLLFGYKEERKGVPDNIPDRIENILQDKGQTPVPNDALRARVHGEKNLSSFIRLGKTVAFDISRCLKEQGFDSDATHKVLDFGCGSGRVIPWLKMLYPNASFHGTDIDEEAITWCQNELSNVGTFSVNQNNPPLTDNDATFDLVYSISIFTHLPEEMQLAWLAELSRVTRPNGLLILTVHGVDLFPHTSGRAYRKLKKKGFYYLKGKGMYGLPSFYQNSYHSKGYIRDTWEKFFKVVHIEPRGIANNQDLVLCQKR